MASSGADDVGRGHEAGTPERKRFGVSSAGDARNRLAVVARKGHRNWP